MSRIFCCDCCYYSYTDEQIISDTIKCRYCGGTAYVTKLLTDVVCVKTHPTSKSLGCDVVASQTNIF